MEPSTVSNQQLFQENTKLHKDLRDITQQTDAFRTVVRTLSQENEALRQQVRMLENVGKEAREATQAKERLESKHFRLTEAWQKLTTEVKSLREDRKVLDKFAMTLDGHYEAQRRGNVGNVSYSILTFNGLRCVAG